MPKIAFSKFEGIHPRIWIDKCVDYFELFKVPRCMWATAASLHMEGNAATWLQVYKQQHGLSDWEVFARAVENKFDAYDYRQHIHDLLSFKQKGSVDEYVAEFDAARYQVAMHKDETLFVSHFVDGLKDEIRGTVLPHVPETVDRAILLAQIQEGVLDKAKARSSRVGTRGPVGASRPDLKLNNNLGELTKERQLRYYRRLNGLCYFCGDKFDADHVSKCIKRPKAQLHNLSAQDLDTDLTEEVLQQLDKEDELQMGKLSLNVLVGTDEGEAVRVRALVQKQVMLLLIDSGSSHSFVNSAFLQRVGIKPTKCKPVLVTLANGDTLISDHMVLGMDWWVPNHTFSTNMRVLDIGAYDAILGFDWLKLHSPMLCHWNEKVLELEDGGVKVKLTGIHSAVTDAQQMSAEHLLKCLKGNEI
ncbi:hypothetical protein QOZ80_3AG0251460 [Eleusine coracana subsp. coracana]|nr:hypothetical protein QOZ80_3AG0251460 [Eleusine coracana subsp. coracana]